ncbi:hypothetical protein [Falsibacillus pallidus]|uniref:hypothetical protein n=1 Tax=Falsibacillus pallidus TaxID=493781 RepID=UPI003D99109C
MSSILLIGFVGVMLVLLFKRPLTNQVGKENRFVHKLRNAEWFQNHWLSGLFLFGLNAVLFFSTVLLIYLLMKLMIPFIHLFVMFMAVGASIYLWILIHKAWGGSRKNRLKMSAVGSSFYLILTIIFVFWLKNLKPAYHGDDMFMASIGLIIATIVTTVAFLTCFGIKGFSKGKTVNG